MKYKYTNIIGTFTVDEKFNLTKEKSKHPDLPEKLLPKVLAKFKDPKYYQDFYKKNLELSKQAMRDSVSEDQLIIQTIANINELDKVINLFTKRLREWFGLHLPELENKVHDPELFVKLILDKKKNDLMKELEIKDSMGADLDKVHLDEIKLLAQQCKNLIELRKQHEEYLRKVMKTYCPNILELAGVTIGAKLIELARSLKRLALLPASTVQLLGAEKALFRHIKTGSRSPKYGVIINHPLIQKAKKSDKGKASKNLADKLSMCARLDFFKGEFKAKEYLKMLEEKFL